MDTFITELENTLIPMVKDMIEKEMTMFALLKSKDQSNKHIREMSIQSFSILHKLKDKLDDYENYVTVNKK